MGHCSDVIDDRKEPTRALRHCNGDVWKGFGDLHRAAVADGVVPSRIKELVALAIAVAQECDGCIAYHASAAARLGATEEEAAEVLGVALLMAGVWAPRAFDAYGEFAAKLAAVAS
jgi:AhpD family alkylhydroperoxidase